MLSDEELKGIAVQVLNMAKRDGEKHQFNFLFAVYNLGDVPPLMRMSRVEALVIERLGEGWLDNGVAKSIAFKVLRQCVDIKPPDAVAFVTLCNGFSPTEKFRGLDPAGQKKLVEKGHDSHHQMVRDGLLTVQDVLLAIVQTPERVCRCHQTLDERKQFLGQPDVDFSTQENFDGRLKMFGKHYDAVTE
jgi:hypothetical protein